MTPPDPLPALLAEHRRLINAIEGNDRQLQAPRPNGFAALAARRWAFARELLLHFAREEAVVLRPLATDRRPHVAAEATRLMAEQSRLIEDFKVHIRRWGAFASAEQWPDYVHSARTLMQRVRRSIEAVESGLYHQMPVQRADSAAPPVPNAPFQHLAEARQIGKLIFKGRPLP